LPTIAGLQAWAYFGTDLAHSQNMVAGASAFTHYGTGPTYLSNAIRCPNGVGAIQTPVPAFAAETHLIVCKCNAQSSARGSVSIVQNLTTGGSSLGFGSLQGGTFIPQNFTLQNTSGTPGSAVVNVTVPGTTSHAFYAGTNGGGTIAQAYDLTHATSASATGTGTNNFFGTHIVGSTAGAPTTPDTSVDIAFWGYYSAVLTKPQIDAIYASVKQSLALRGIAV
jgi:hypothetical protein